MRMRRELGRQNTCPRGCRAAHDGADGRAGLGETVAVVTDGELSGLNSGITIGQAMPEAAEGGPLAAVRDGDTIAIDLNRKTIALEVTLEELAERLAALPPLPPTKEKGWLAMYRQLVQPLSKGAVLGER
jgi:dihydroxy-acid dehydratase